MTLRITLFALLFSATPALAEEDPQAWCATFFEHMHGLMMQSEMIAGKYAESSDEDKAAYERDMTQACVEAWEIPGEKEIMLCVQQQTTFDGMQTCMAPAQEQMKLRMKRAEAPSFLDGIRTAEKAYHAEFDRYLVAPATPAEIPGVEPVPFAGGGKAAFDELGASFLFDQVLCRYSVRLTNDDGTPVEDGFEARAECDIDGDGVTAIYRATASQRAVMVTDEDVY